MNIRCLHVLIFILRMYQIGAGVSIFQTGVHTELDNCQFGDEIVISCQINDYSGLMSWYNDSSNIAFAECFFDICTLDPDVANKYDFLTDTSTGTFNLTFNISAYHNGTTYMCNDGLNTDSILILITENSLMHSNHTTESIDGLSHTSEKGRESNNNVNAAVVVVVSIIIPLALAFSVVQFVCFLYIKRWKRKSTKCLVYARVCIPVYGICIIHRESFPICLSGKAGYDQEGGFKVKKVTETSISVRWKRCNINGNKSTYSLEYLDQSGNRSEKSIADTKKNFMACTIENLGSSTYYKLNLRCLVRGSELIEEYEPIDVRTYGKPDPPTNIGAQNVTNTSMKVVWNAGFNGGFPQRFRVHNIASYQDLSPTIVPESKDRENIYQCDLTGLRPSTYYTLKVSAENKKGIVESEESNIRTNGKPYSPQNFRGKKKYTKDTSITVRWTAGSNGGYRQHFVVAISGKGVKDRATISDDDGGKGSFHKTWTGLNESTNYVITLYAKNDFGKTKKEKINIMTNDKRKRRKEGSCNMMTNDQLDGESIGLGDVSFDTKKSNLPNTETYITEDLTGHITCDTKSSNINKKEEYEASWRSVTPPTTPITPSQVTVTSSDHIPTIWSKLGDKVRGISANFDDPSSKDTQFG